MRNSRTCILILICTALFTVHMYADETDALTHSEVVIARSVFQLIKRDCWRNRIQRD